LRVTKAVAERVLECDAERRSGFLSQRESAAMGLATITRRAAGSREKSRATLHVALQDTLATGHFDVHSSAKAGVWDTMKALAAPRDLVV
jgi:hypothetical protein